MKHIVFFLNAYDVIRIFCKCFFFECHFFHVVKKKIKHLPLAETVKHKLSNTRAHKRDAHA